MHLKLYQNVSWISPTTVKIHTVDASDSIKEFVNPNPMFTPLFTDRDNMAARLIVQPERH